MPRLFTSEMNYDEVSEMLLSTLTMSPIIPIAANINSVPTSKGIYFWFMHPDGYKALSNFVKINPLTPRVQMEISKVNYDLVYLGTAGTGKKIGSNLLERLKWHIQQNHTESSVCHGTISTLRAGVGSLISDDLINTNTEQLVNQLFEQCFKIYYLPYKLDEEDNIDFDEKQLIKTLMPLLNIKNNPNARSVSIDNPTKRYRVRRNEIINASRARLNCNNSSNDKPKTTKYMHQIIEETNDCIEFTVSQSQSIHEVIRGIDNLPKGKCSILITDSNDSNQIVYAKTNNIPYRTTGSGSQDIYSYFKNIDTSKDNVPRWKVIQNEMIRKGIDEILVTVNWSNNFENFPNNELIFSKDYKLHKDGNRLSVKNENSSVIKISKYEEYSDDDLIERTDCDKVKYLINCASKKNRIGLSNHNRGLCDLTFNDVLYNSRVELIDILKNSKFHKRKIQTPENSKNSKQKSKTEFIDIHKQNIEFINIVSANKLYSDGILYKNANSINWNDNQRKQVYILSALFGIICANDYIPYYDLAMDDILINENEKSISPKKFWQENEKLDLVVKELKRDGKLIDIVSQDYRTVFSTKGSPISDHYTPKGKSDTPKKRGIWLKNQLDQCVS